MLGLPLAFILSQDQTLRCLKFLVFWLRGSRHFFVSVPLFSCLRLVLAVKFFKYHRWLLFCRLFFYYFKRLNHFSKSVCDSELRCKVTNFFVYLPNFSLFIFQILFCFKIWFFVWKSLCSTYLRLQSSEVFLRLPNLFLQLVLVFYFSFFFKNSQFFLNVFNVRCFCFAVDCWCQTQLQS